MIKFFDIGQKYMMHYVTDKLSTQYVYIRREVRTWHCWYYVIYHSIYEQEKPISNLSDDNYDTQNNNSGNAYIAWDKIRASMQKFNLSSKDTLIQQKSDYNSKRFF